LVRDRRDLALKVPPSGQSLEFFNVAREQHASNPALLPILLVHLGHLIHNAPPTFFFICHCSQPGN
jgi:hypothetical protein